MSERIVTLRQQLAGFAEHLPETELRVLLRCANKLAGEGLREHGPIDFSMDNRDLHGEVMDETADALVYALMIQERGNGR